jgi:transcriptional regulator with XRE-family HTH domain
VEHDRDWPGKLAAEIGGRIARLRAERKMTAQHLAGRCAGLGLPLDRTVIAKLEKGLRQMLTVGELLVLARALGVPPLTLVFPVGEEKTTEILPGQIADTWQAAKWLTGEDGFPGDLAASPHAGDLFLYRQHDRHEEDEYLGGLAALDAEAKAGKARTAAERDLRLAQAEAWRQSMRQARAGLLEVRATMRSRGLVLPEPDLLAEESGDVTGL